MLNNPFISNDLGKKLNEAALKNDIVTMHSLIKRGANLNYRGEGGRTALHQVLGFHTTDAFLAVLEMMSQRELENNLPKPKLSLGKPSSASVIDCLRLLVNAGADVHLTDDDGRSPLAWATFLMNSEAIIFLSEAGAKVNTKDKRGYTPLRSAARLKMDDVVISSLVGASADITSSNYESLYAQSTLVEAEKIKIR